MSPRAFAPPLAAALLAVLGLAPAAAAQAGSAATTVLRLAPSPRALALGSALVATDDAFALEFNPGALGPGSRAAASFQALPVDASAGAAVLAFGAPAGAAALSLRFVDYGQVDVIEDDGTLPVGTPTGATASGGELTALAAYAFDLGRLRIGAAGRWLRLDVAGLTDDAWAGDIGALLALSEALALGAAVQNLGPDVEAGRPAPLPLTLRAGGRIRRVVGGVDVLFAFEGRRRESRTGIGAGLEVGAGLPSLRAEGRVGYESRFEGDAYSRLVFGGGVRVERWMVDFAYRALGPLGSTRQVGISVTF